MYPVIQQQLRQRRMVCSWTAIFQVDVWPLLPELMMSCCWWEAFPFFISASLWYCPNPVDRQDSVLFIAYLFCSVCTTACIRCNVTDCYYSSMIMPVASNEVWTSWYFSEMSKSLFQLRLQMSHTPRVTSVKRPRQNWTPATEVATPPPLSSLFFKPWLLALTVILQTQIK